ncbi:MAG: bifunctional metallophosphatase/5'-nucleotidase [Nocardioides sp.]
MRSISRVRPRARSAAALLGLGLVAGSVALVATPAHAAPVSITLLTVNDFHGRIDANTTKWATTIETIRAAKGEGSTALIGAGDNIGASLFASAYAQDEPTVRVLNALDMTATATGNHEFDRGFAWLETNLIQGTNPDYTPADFPILGANVRDKATGDPAMSESYRTTVGGLDVCVIGAVTQETPSLVSPDGVASLTFKAPVGEVNRVAAAMEAADPCDVTVASYHEGAPAGEPEGATLESQVAASPVFADIVDHTSPLVDVIVTGHTHKRYAWSAPVPGEPGVTRPVIQTGSYGDFVGEVDLTVDNGVVTAHTEQNVPRAAAADLTMPRVQAVKSIVDDAVAAADAVGNKAVGSVTADITTAFTGGSYGPEGYAGGTRDDRASESTLGHLVADALHDTPVAGQPHPDLGITNPGGLRSELLYAGDTGTSPENTDGVVTFEEANAVLPFVNNISYVDLTGAQLRQVLEQQWQTNADGSIPSRPFLALGLSRNVTVLLDPDRPLGHHVTAVRVDGRPLDPRATYTVATFSFLAAGGDNFRAFTAGRAADTGKVDRDLWIDGFLADGHAKSPDFARREVFGSTPRKVRGGEHVAFDLQRLGLTSLGARPDTAVTATLRQPGRPARVLGSFPVTDGAASIDLTLPVVVARGSTLQLTTDVSRTRIPVQAAPAPREAATLTVAVAPDRVVADRTRPRVTVRVRRADGPATGWVDVFVAGRLHQVRLVDGRGVARLDPFARVGDHRVRVKYLGNATTHPVTQVLHLRVHRH